MIGQEGYGEKWVWNKTKTRLLKLDGEKIQLIILFYLLLGLKFFLIKNVKVTELMPGNSLLSTGKVGTLISIAWGCLSTVHPKCLSLHPLSCSFQALAILNSSHVWYSFMFQILFTYYTFYVECPSSAQNPPLTSTPTNSLSGTNNTSSVMISL